MADSPFTTADFHNVVQKQVLNAVYQSLAAGKMDWELVAPFVEAARQLCRSDFQEAARIRLHTTRADGDQWIDSEEAFLGVAVADRDDGQEWLSDTYWLSDIALADGDPVEVRRIVAALERSLEKIRAWLAENEGGAEPQGTKGSA